MAAATGEREEVVLETRGLTKHFGGVRAVDGVDLTIPWGDLRAIIGPNGAGKTTLFNLITGDLRRESGYISFRGKRSAGCRRTRCAAVASGARSRSPASSGA